MRKRNTIWRNDLSFVFGRARQERCPSSATLQPTGSGHYAVTPAGFSGLGPVRRHVSPRMCAMSPHFAAAARRASLALSFCAACSSTEVTDSGGAIAVAVQNDGSVAFTDLRIRTSEEDSLPRIATLNAGQYVGPYHVRALHSAPLVQATVQGRAVIAHPVEGFAGFNPALPQGAYLVRLRVTDGILDVRVAPMPVTASSAAAASPMR